MNLEAIAVFYFDFRFSVILNAVKNPVETTRYYSKELDSSSVSLLRMTEKNKSRIDGLDSAFLSSYAKLSDAALPAELGHPHLLVARMGRGARHALALRAARLQA